VKIETFKLNKDFRRLYGRGKSIVFPTVVVYYLKNRLNYCRFGVTAGKKVGCAVYRNRAKRVILASFRELLPHISGGYDFVFVARAKTAKVKSTVVFNSLKKAFLNEGIITEYEKNTDSDD
jgi:ribonuclease P protein component